jgi:hypothetical protein
MNKTEAVEYVQQQVALRKPESQIIATLCRETSMDEAKARRFITYAKQQDTPAAEVITLPQRNEPPDKMTQYVVRSLGRHASENDIITYLCTEGGMSWSQAEAFIANVKQTQSKTISRKQTPLYMILAVGVIIGGLWLAWFGVVQGWVMIDPDTAPIVQTERMSRRVLSNTVFIIGSIPIGLSMVAAGVIALRKQLKNIR